jgi:predicted DCC family thiol-disulfide oxidoreductase YuxK
VFFDGVCALCNRFVRRLLRADRGRELRFAPLQGETARRLLPSQPQDPAHWSILYLDAGGLHARSDAVLRILARTKGPLRWLSLLLRAVPRFVRDALYRLVARRRYRWFGELPACPVPDPTVRDRMLP